MIGNYDLWLCHWNGTRLAYLDSFIELDYTRALGAVGALVLRMPSSFDVNLLQTDYKIEIWRGTKTLSSRLENVYLLRGWRKEQDDTGVDSVVLVGLDGNDILNWRTVVGNTDSSYIRKTGLGGNILRAYMRAAIASTTGSGIGMTAQRDDIAAYFAVASDVSEWSAYSGADPSSSFTKNYMGKTLFEVAEGICGTSAGRGYPLYWRVEPLSRSLYRFVVYAPLAGQDRSASIIVRPDNGMVTPVHEYDVSEELTICWGAGRDYGDGDGRQLARAWDNIRNKRTPFSYHERFVDGGSEQYSALLERIKDELADEDNLPRETFNCQINNVAGLEYMLDWDLGDRLGFQYRGLDETAVVMNAHVEIDENKAEKIYTSFEIEPELEITG